MLGFNLIPHSERYVDPNLFKEITEWITGPKFVGEFGTSRTEDIKIAIQEYALDFIETSNIDEIEALADLGKPLILKVELMTNEQVNILLKQLPFLDGLIQYLVIDGNLNDQDLSSFMDHATSFSLLKAFDNSTETVMSLSEKWTGIQLEAPPEERPGYADYGIVMDILEAIEID